MIIAINTRIVSGNTASAGLLQSCVQKIASENPEHFFVFISEKKNNQQVPALKNISHQIIERRPGNSLFWKLWYNYKLPALLRKIKADALVNADGICSLRSKLPQFIVVNNIAPFAPEDWYSKNYKRFIRANQEGFLQKAVHIFAMSNILQQKIISRYKIDTGKISLLYPGCDENYQPLKWDEKEQVKEQYTAGKDYFLFNGKPGPGSNLINLLKAFSFFKRRQKSNMQLVIITENGKADDGFTTSLTTYKYRREVVVLGYPAAEELYKITAAAYAFVSPSAVENNYSNLLNAMQCGVPIVVSNNETNNEMFAETALYTDSNSFEDIADKMMLLFKDEKMRTRNIETGLHRLQNFSWQKSVAELWKTILAAIQ